MTFEIELDGTRRRVAVRRSSAGWRAEIDGREVEVSIVERGGGWSMVVGPPPVLPAEGGNHEPSPVASALSRQSYDVAFESTSDGGLIVHVNGVAVPLTVRDEPAAPKSRTKAAGRRTDVGGDARPHTIVAPMPGRIVRVLVKPDEAVAARQPLVVVEAMKMENELRAPRAGIVGDIRVAEGASVEANTVLMVLK